MFKNPRKKVKCGNNVLKSDYFGGWKYKEYDVIFVAFTQGPFQQATTQLELFTIITSKAADKVRHKEEGTC